MRTWQRHLTSAQRRGEAPALTGRVGSSIGGWIACLAALLLIVGEGGVSAGVSSHGEIRVPLKLAENQDIERIAQVIAVQRRAQTMHTRRGDELDIGLEAVPHRGRIEPAGSAPREAQGDGQGEAQGEAQGSPLVHAIFENLPVPGRYDLRIEFTDGSIIHGWNANVPASDYLDDPQIEPAQVRDLLQRQSSDEFTAFFDHVVVLDVQGNVQNASVLVAQLRQRPFVGGGYQDGEWVWRVDRWQWEDPWEHNWTPYQERPFYALVRQRVFEGQFNALRWRFARHLGGLALTADEPVLKLDPLALPAPGAGVRAVEPDGQPIDPTILKGHDRFSPNAGHR